MVQLPLTSSLEELLMASIQLLGENAYGVTIYDKARELAHPSRISFGSIYPTLERLEKKGFLSSCRGGSTSERGGRAKRFFHLEALGERSLSESRRKAFRILSQTAEAAS